MQTNTQHKTPKALSKINCSPTKTLCVLAMLVAAYALLDFLATQLSAVTGGQLKISFTGLPVVLGAMFFGPLGGGAVGLLGAFINQLFSPYGLTATTLLWVLPGAMRGVSMGLLFWVFGRKTNPLLLGGEVLASALIMTAFNALAQWADALIFAYPSGLTWALIGVRLVSAVITSLCITAVLLPIYKPLAKVLNR